MNLPKQLINVLGAVLVVAILVAGVMLAGLPLYGSAQTTDANTRTVAQTNQIYEIQVAQLAAENERIDELDTQLGALQTELPGSPRLDDVIEIVVAAAHDTGSTIESVEVGEIEVWTPRTGLDEGTGDNTAPADDAPSEETGAGDAASTAGGETAPEAPTDGPATGEDSPQKQIAVTIDILVPDAAAATAFMDGLGRGARLIAPIDGTLADGVLTVTALAFMRTGD